MQTGIVDMQAGHQLAQHVQVSGHGLHLRQLLGDLARTARRLCGLIQLLQALVERLQGAVAGQKAPGGRPDLLAGLLQGGQHGIDGRGIDVAQLTDAQQLAALLADGIEGLDEFIDLLPVLRLQPCHQGTMVVPAWGHVAG